jgi:hypothetical protein
MRFGLLSLGPVGDHRRLDDALLLAVVLASGCLWGCGGNVEAPGPDGGYQDNSPVPADATATTDTLAATDSPIATDSPVATDSPAGAPACGDGGSQMACGVINLPNTVTAMAINNTTNTLYAAMVAAPNAGDTNGGIAVIDTTTNAVTTTMAPPTIDGGAVGPYLGHLMVADETSNLIYAARPAYCQSAPPCAPGAVEIIDVYDGATKAYKTSLDIAALDPNCSPYGSGLQWLAVDGARALLYVNCDLHQINGGIEIAVIGTGATPYRAADIVLTDLPGGGFGSAGLALDTTHRLLFANVGNLVDEVDTATNYEVAGSQQNVDGGVVAILGGAGYATLVTDEPVPDGGIPDGSTASTFFSLEPGKVSFTKLADSVVPSPMCPGRYVVVFDSELATFPIAAVQVSATEGIAPVVTNTSQRTVPVPPGTVRAFAAMAVGGNEHFYMYTEYAGNGGPYPGAGISVCDYP